MLKHYQDRFRLSRVERILQGAAIAVFTAVVCFGLVYLI